KACPVGWSSFNHSCYLLSESFGSWDAARKDCRDRGTDLVVIDSAEEQKVFTTNLAQWRDSSNLTWLKISTALDPRFKDLKCLSKDERREVRASVHDLLMAETHAHQPFAQTTEEPSPKKSKISICLLDKTCPVGWSSFNHSCYLLSESFGSWDAARRDCRGREADLVVIDSPEEENLLSKITTEVWIGLNDKEQEGTWKWVDGTPLNLTLTKYWADGQPDNGGGNPLWGEEDCAQIRTFDNTLWNDISCRNSLPWVCEKIP
ncbi:CD209 antigen-like protein E, partial [Neolamprologus brichardi]|uniref:CD209 antigen-like protein E n=1 Tax=Neolamprologus brichardi TaxID=32507 RepID=UPI001643900B